MLHNFLGFERKILHLHPKCFQLLLTVALNLCKLMLIFLNINGQIEIVKYPAFNVNIGDVAAK